MPGHIYSRLGLWQKDIDSQLGSIAAAEGATKYGESGLMDEPHSYDFLLYAYLQAGQDEAARATLKHSDEPLTMIDSMPEMSTGHMAGMIPYYRAKLPIFYGLETRDWTAVAAMEPFAGSPPIIATQTYWARAEAHGRLHQAAEAKADLAKFDALVEEVKHGDQAYMAEGSSVTMERDEIAGWAAFAAKHDEEAIKLMRAAADLQDKVGQGEVDIPAREMLADMLLDLHRPKEALAEYEVALKLSPNRFNGLYNAGQAAEMAGDKTAQIHQQRRPLQTPRNRPRQKPDQLNPIGNEVAP
jgi:tetratricopeptide (TPR) repeat protein